MPVWRLVLNKTATLEEIERCWSITDVYKANALLDYEADQASMKEQAP